ncbi:3-beta-hydroxysteroid-Delta(8) [Escovopsis weberi]|uniref:3-beta-hydroxysteroid-Delta(8) n=1 Tax=Escovopsis weberi TaxID=150374 RepID=A0A0M8N0K5_ESCWE|nr:3-beta-hydroxysteroid-Delta(8) [Escovopsis weberi]
MNDSNMQHGEDASVATLHPYYPFGIELPGYVPNTMNAFDLVLRFAAGSAVVFLATLFVVKRCRPSISKADALAAMWFALCGCIHFFFEGYYAVNSFDMASRTDLFGQLWKEYALSDSRYLIQDPFMVCMESVTALLWGPLSFALVYMIVADHPLRHVFQLIVSVGQIYGDVLYYAICAYQELVNAVVYCRPEKFYFWAYYFLCNAFWIVIPLMLVIQSACVISETFAKAKASSLGKKSQ